MAQRFHVLITPGCQRDIRYATKRNRALVASLEHILDILEHDPHNVNTDVILYSFRHRKDAY